MRIGLLVVLMWVLVWPAFAQSVHKCADGRGGHSYQSQPCMQGETLRTWEIDIADPPQVASPPRAKPAAPRRSTRSTTPSKAASRVRASPRDNQHARCLAARASRDDALRKLGNKRRYDDLRQLNARVSAVCNHRGRG